VALYQSGKRDIRLIARGGKNVNGPWIAAGLATAGRAGHFLRHSTPQIGRSVRGAIHSLALSIVHVPVHPLILVDADLFRAEVM
jgi:hypothetical protein